MDGTSDRATSRDADDELDGLPLDAAAAALADDDGDRAAVESTLGLAVEDGVVRWDALEAELATVSMVVSTPETRLELATAAVADAREAAGAAPDEPIVSRRLDALDDRLANVTEDVAALAPELREIAGRIGEPGELYGVAADLRALRARANEQQRLADELIDDAEAFEAWLGSAPRRRREFESDLDALASVVDGTETALDRADGSDGDAAALDAAAGHVVSGLLVTDLRAELATLRDWPGDGEDVDWAEPGERLSGLATRREGLCERVDAVAGEAVTAIRDAAGPAEPPVAWERVEAAIDDYREPA